MLLPPEDDVSLYDYELPPDRIAQKPLAERSASRLLVLTGESGPQHHTFWELPELLNRGDLLVRNTTKVFPARLRGRRSGGGKTELLLIRRTEPLTWECL
ncbi:MAG: S-adenosylmethionine:tRNA ribosyltransferase-isomerase, partial [Planctomycetes bacterium]|nr:S-adenosylmethionine:tRNA ribosyltransferase-isomerase [Planctomycetota bacterium]